MKHTHVLAIPTTLQDACHPQRMALLVYDMQVGICSQVKTANFVRSYITVCAESYGSANIKANQISRMPATSTTQILNRANEP